MIPKELDWLKKWNLYSPEAVAIKDGETAREFTYAEFFRFANIAAFYLKSELGIKKGDRIAVLATNELEYVFLFFAAQRLGALLVPINYRLTQREVEHIVKDCSPQLIVYQAEYAPIVSDLNVPFKLQLTPQNDENGRTNSIQTLSEIIQSRPFQEVPFVPEFEDPCMIIYTSGTTGAPKGAVLTFEMLFWNSVNTTLRLNLSQNDCTIIFLPFFHTGGWNVLTTPFIHRGAKVVFLKKFDADKILELSAAEKATILFGVPTTMDLMARSPLFHKVDLSLIRYAIVGGEPMPIELIKTWHKKGVPIRQGYGLTEFGPNVFSLNEQDAIRKIGSIGFPNFYISAKVVDEKNNELQAGEVGELVLQGPSCMWGYWNQPQATRDTIINGWLHTGDLVRQDGDGYFYVVGRKKDMFKSGGENVYPVELEQVIHTLNGIREVAVIGVPDKKWGEVGKAFIVSDLNSLTLEDVQKHCSKNLAKFKIPKYFEFLASLPKGDSGKILKKKLRENSF